MRLNDGEVGAQGGRHDVHITTFLTEGEIFFNRVQASNIPWE